MFSIRLRYVYLFLFIFTAIITITIPLLATDKLDSTNNVDGEQLIQQVNAPVEKQIVMISHYIVGQDNIETTTATISSVYDIEEKFSEWSLVTNEENKVVLERLVEDISPECKDGAYFAISPEGYLTLYHDNVNEENDETIQTFFRINIKSLESGLPQEPIEQLYQGIPIRDLAEFNSVLSTYSEFSSD